MTYQKKRAEQSRAAILQAAESLFLDHGYSISLETIRLQSGVSKATLFSHFSNKQSLFFSVVEAMGERETVRIVAPLGAPGDYLDNLLDFVSRFTSAVATKAGSGLFRLAVIEANRFPDIAAGEYREGMGKILPMVAAFLRKGQDQGLIRSEDSAMLAEQLIASALGYRQYRILLGFEAEQSNNAAYVQSAIIGVLADAGRAAWEDMDVSERWRRISE